MSAKSGKAFDWHLLKRVMVFLKPYKGVFNLTAFLTIFLSLVSVARPLLISFTIDEYMLRNPDQHLFFRMILLIIGLLILEGLVQFFQTYLANWLGHTVTIDIRTRLFQHISNFKLKYFDRTPIGTLVTRVISDIETIANIFSQGLLVMIGDILKLVVVLLAMFIINWKLALLILIPVPVLILATNIFKNIIKRAFQQVRTQVARLNTFVQEHVTGMAIIQVFAREEEEERKFRQINKEHMDAHVRTVFANAVFFPVVELLSALSMAFLIWFGVRYALEGLVTPGEVFAYIFFIHMLYRPIRQLADKFNVLQMGVVGSERVFAVLDTVEEIDDSGRLEGKEIKGDIRFDKVWFSYKDEDWVLKDLSFEVRQGQMLALVGATGAGKSSVINLLSRFYEYNKGDIYLDGEELRKYRLSFIRSSIAVVLQDVFLFSDSVFNNITLGDESISREQVIEASKKVGAHDFIDRLPGGYDYNVRERGASLSTGQRQLIAFIRAYVFDPKILVLDEATSSIDTESELMLQRAMEKLTEGRTSIVIAHRLSTIRKADKILVLDKGEIVEQGNHAGLLEKEGHYKRLYDLQFK